MNARGWMGLGIAGVLGIACSEPRDERTPSGLVTGASSATSGSQGTEGTGIEPSDSSNSGPSDTQVDSSTADDGPSDSTNTEGSADTIVYDLGAPDPGSGGSDGTGTSGCQSVDVVLMVDNSPSMINEQERLISSFPGFAAAIRSSLAEVDDYHIGVITSDAFALNAPASCRNLGDLVTHNGQSQNCGPFASGLRYMTQDDDLDQAFVCAGAVGDAGAPTEQQIGALLAATAPAAQTQGQCNEGFLRNDSLLVVVMLTEEPDQMTPGNGDDWYDNLVANRGGLANNIVMLSLLWDANDPACVLTSTEYPAAQIETMTARFGERGFVGSICSDDYGAFFSASLDTIVQACEELEPAK